MAMVPLSLTIIVAIAKSDLGIGNLGALPWKLKSELKYFSNVTQYCPELPGTSNLTRRINAVIMGRKTWESIPSSQRPLRNRLNIVLSRSYESINSIDTAAEKIYCTLTRDSSYILGVNNLNIALDILSKLSPISKSPRSPKENISSAPLLLLNRIFIIGGVSIFNEALNLQNTKNILLTRIGSNSIQFPCDTFFPIDLRDDTVSASHGWLRQPHRLLETEFVGKAIQQYQREDNVDFEVCLLTRSHQ